MNRILDVATWRCGGHGSNQLGSGICSMTNARGYSCCLGQFANASLAELYPDFRYVTADSDSFGVTSNPSDVAYQLLSAGLNPIYDSSFVVKEQYEFENTRLAYELMKINDDSETTPSEKIDSIRVLLAEHGQTLEVRNIEFLPS